MVTLTVLSAQNLQGGVVIEYGYQQTAFGTCLLASIGNAICHLSFLDEHEQEGYITLLHQLWPDATLINNQLAIHKLIDRIFDPSFHGADPDIELIVRGTAFEVAVWRELLNIPIGATISYRDVALRMGRPRAVRAVAAAIARNRISYLIPCHRVIKSSGQLHYYRWGAERKRKLLQYEQAIH